MPPSLWSCYCCAQALWYYYTSCPRGTQEDAVSHTLTDSSLRPWSKKSPSPEPSGLFSDQLVLLAQPGSWQLNCSVAHTFGISDQFRPVRMLHQAQWPVWGGTEQWFTNSNSMTLCQWCDQEGGEFTLSRHSLYLPKVPSRQIGQLSQPQGVELASLFLLATAFCFSF